MNIFETVYCSQYYELKKTGRDPMKGRLNGTLLNATIIILIAVSVFLLCNRFLPLYRISGFFRHLGEDIPAKTIGKLLGLVGMLVIGGLIHFTYGSEANYRRMSERWEGLPEEVLQRTIRTSLRFFIIVFAISLIIILSSVF